MTWLEFVYQYIVGGLFFFITMALCFRPGGSDISHPADRRSLFFLLLGFAGYFLAHAAWIILAAR